MKKCSSCSQAFDRYGFRLRKGMSCYTAYRGSCCPKKVTVVDWNEETVKFCTGDGVEHQKSFLDFMKSSWPNRTDF